MKDVVQDCVSRWTAWGGKGKIEGGTRWRKNWSNVMVTKQWTNLLKLANWTIDGSEWNIHKQENVRLGSTCIKISLVPDGVKRVANYEKECREYNQGKWHQVANEEVEILLKKGNWTYLQKLEYCSWTQCTVAIFFGNRTSACKTRTTSVRTESQKRTNIGTPIKPAEECSRCRVAHMEDLISPERSDVGFEHSRANGNHEETNVNPKSTRRLNLDDRSGGHVGEWRRIAKISHDSVRCIT